MSSEASIFEKIIAGEIPATFEYRDDQCVAIRDIDPQAPTHILIVPCRRIDRVGEAKQTDESLLGHLIFVSGLVARNLGLEQGYRIVINNGPHGGETVPHLHVHLIGGRQLQWPPG
ncbi:MAG: histidine triad nucleotide-binding protein [Puniceicoccaceae bacterium]